MFHKETKSNDLVTGILIGAVVGAVAGILLAPKGHDIAQDIADGTGNFIKQAKSRLTGHHADESSPYWLGGILGALLGGSSAIILTPKSSRVLREYIADSYQNVSDRTWQLINNLNEKGEEIADLLKGQTSVWAERSLEITESVTDEVREWAEALRDAASEAQQKAEQFGKNPAYQNKISEVLNWSQKALEIADEVTHEVKNWKESIQSVIRDSSHPARRAFEQDGHHKHSTHACDTSQTVSQLVDWATVGFNIWQNLQSKKR